MCTHRVMIRPPAEIDCENFLAASRRSRALHAPWVHPPLNARDFQRYLLRFAQPDHEGRLVCLIETGELVGLINLNNIIRGYFQNAFLGFYGFLPHAGTGLMSEGLRLVVEEAFTSLDLHRLEANIQPDNRRSIELVKRAGFRKEGISPGYLRIGGVWRDHERWALRADPQNT